MIVCVVLGMIKNVLSTLVIVCILLSKVKESVISFAIVCEVHGVV